jgi:hypothetical protein
MAPAGSCWPLGGYGATFEKCSPIDIMKTMATKFVMALGVGTALSAFGQKTLVNGDFEMGNIGFTSAYAYSPGSHYLNEGQYDVVTNPHLDHPLGASFGDHTTGGGFMLAFNGSSDTNSVVWSETVSVSPNTTYVFSGWGASWGDTGHDFDPSPAILRIFINGQQYSADVHLAATNGLWQSYAVVWDSQSSAQAIIEIHDENTAGYGNDFALDDLSFSPICNTPTSTGIVQATISSGSNSNVSQQVWAPQPKPLPSDRSFGFALPGGVGLTHRIEASADLVHWVQATNVSLYFKDADSTNCNQRFYRFEK